MLPLAPRMDRRKLRDFVARAADRPEPRIVLEHRAAFVDPQLPLAARDVDEVDSGGRGVLEVSLRNDQVLVAVALELDLETFVGVGGIAAGRIAGHVDVYRYP